MLKLSPGIKGIGLVLLIMPLAHVLVQGTMDLGLDKYGEIAMPVLGIGLVLATIRIRSSTIQASAGLLAGILLWGAIGELGGLLQSGSSHGESHVHGAPTLGQWSLILVILIFYGLMGFKPFGRVIGEGRAARRLGTFVAFEFFVIVWFFHVVLLTTFYHPWFGPDSPIMYVVLALCATGVLVVKPYLLRARNLGEGIRVGVWAGCFFWTGLEVTMKWGWLAKPWIPMRFGMLSVIALFFLALVMMPVRDVYEEKSIGEE